MKKPAVAAPGSKSASSCVRSAVAVPGSKSASSCVGSAVAVPGSKSASSCEQHTKDAVLCAPRFSDEWKAFLRGHSFLLGAKLVSG